MVADVGSTASSWVSGVARRQVPLEVRWGVRPDATSMGDTTLAFFGENFAAPLWLYYILIALVVCGLIGALLTRRKRAG